MSATAHDVAAYVLSRFGAMSAMKFQKLAYYSQAWTLALLDEPLFSERIEAWAHGPVVPVLYRMHRGLFVVSDWPQGHSGRLSHKQCGFIDDVLSHYAPKTADELIDLTHSEAPWIDARRGLPSGARATVEIPPEAMSTYYRTRRMPFTLRSR